jgi:hypothetical protein
MLQVTRVIFSAVVQWLGEAVVGLIPLAAHLLTHEFGEGPYVSALCVRNVDKLQSFYSQCKITPESPLQEICVLAVVISGLSLLSIGQFASGRRKSPRNAITYLMQLLAILSLLAGGLFYALISAHLDSGHESWTYVVLGVALVSSFVLAMQESIGAMANEVRWDAVARPLED